MMKIEKELAQQNLDVFNPSKLIAKEILKYRKFKTSVALKKINHCSYKPATVKAFFDQGLRYLRTGEYNRRTGVGSVVKYIEQYKSAISALQPTESEQRRPYKPYKTARTASITPKQPKPLITKTNTLTEAFIYMVRSSANNSVFIFKTLKEVEAFKQGVYSIDPSIKIFEQQVALKHLANLQLAI